MHQLMLKCSDTRQASVLSHEELNDPVINAARPVLTAGSGKELASVFKDHNGKRLRQIALDKVRESIQANIDTFLPGAPVFKLCFAWDNELLAVASAYRRISCQLIGERDSGQKG